MFDIRSRCALGREFLKPLRPLCIAFYINAFLITGRNIYRIPSNSHRYRSWRSAARLRNYRVRLGTHSYRHGSFQRLPPKSVPPGKEGTSHGRGVGWSPKQNQPLQRSKQLRAFSCPNISSPAGPGVRVPEAHRTSDTYYTR
ncbi:hypothetical protein BOTBODRAFT_51805 [Botryobasidium botryosum FD-172 SS1]|uniref:Uncharacterized protein n=1 Tax=Botryobasidium botryosum (strain FD-172 SS1) TaxID=930990 RepID=A0A067N5J7_BOTB1|nr:hypothetical protein BOTBODRAFT_51805 [Botryobasidium botryosum FD-172 SS1]